MRGREIGTAARRALAAGMALAATTAARAQEAGVRPAGASAQAARAAGEWTFRMSGDAQPQRVTLAAEGDTLRGRVYGQPLAGTLVRDRLAFSVGDYRWYATLRGDSLDGWLRIGSDSSRWNATRYRRPAAARAYAHEPTSWQREVRADVAPVLRLHAGDTVRTWSVDAGGWGTAARGAKGNKRSPGGNPLTGPFVVEGALPGDVLVVKLLRVRLNRGWAFSGTGLIDDAITPGYAAARKGENLRGDWVLDTLAGVARLASPSPALAGFTVPLRPFLGAVAVAPGGTGAPSSRESGAWGGNMEYAQLREGTTLHLPVGVEGAWLYLGDGHAAQGDGEVTGDALETSMDVAFTVEIRRWGFNAMPRAETAEHLMSIGVAGSLDQAVRQATSDMARWLEQDYGLTASEAAIVLGFALSYDIPDLVPPQVSVVARIPKSALESLRRKQGRPRS